MKIIFIVYIFISTFSWKSILSYRRLKDINNMDGIPQGFSKNKQINFHELRSNANKDKEKAYTYEISEWIIMINPRNAKTHTGKIRSIEIYSMTYPYEQLEVFKEKLKGP
ncbi:conserved Plasmodium protein, unknown function [Plasmodium sp. gorilla clade G1]|nr:conserved Plasmodium protein, unknown function [Plasmodium sp. gorilla clade G1]